MFWQGLDKLFPTTLLAIMQQCAKLPKILRAYRFCTSVALAKHARAGKRPVASGAKPEKENASVSISAQVDIKKTNHLVLCYSLGEVLLHMPAPRYPLAS